MDELTVVIQAGGESKRMGQPKAIVSFCGLPLICRLLKRLGGIADELIITSNDQASLDFLCSKVSLNKLKMCSDVFEKRGALNGLHTALLNATKPYVAVIACDMVFASAPLIIAERDALVASGADVAVTRTSHGYEPFHAVYRRETCLPVVREALLTGETRAHGWFDKVRLYEFSSEEALEADPCGGFFLNVNTPEELKELEKRSLNGSVPSTSSTSSAPSVPSSQCPPPKTIWTACSNCS